MSDAPESKRSKGDELRLGAVSLEPKNDPSDSDPSDSDPLDSDILDSDILSAKSVEKERTRFLVDEAIKSTQEFLSKFLGISSQEQKSGTSKVATSDYDEIIRDAIKRGAVDVTITKCVTLGPPEAGKTQLKRALLGDFTEANEGTPVSTQAIPAVEIYASGKGKWVQLDMGQLKGAIQATASGKFLPSKNANTAPASCIEKHSHKLNTFSDIGSWVQQSKFSFLRKNAESAILDDVNPSSSINLHKAHLLYMVDNGGQPSFLDIHSAIATFPATYFLVYNAEEGLDAKPKMTYRKKEFPTKTFSSSMSNHTFIRRSLLTLHHLRPKLSTIQDEMKDRTSCEFRSNPPVFIVGTHIREDQSFEKDEDRLSSLLQSIPSLERIWETHFVNSLDPSCSVIKGLQQSLHNNYTSCSFRLPLSWFHLQLMCLALDAEEVPDLSLQIQAFVDLRNRCLEENLVASHGEFEAMIRVFHSLGVFSCPDLELTDEVESWVVFTSPNLLYSIVTKILDIPLRDVTISNKPLLDLQATGEISLEGLSSLELPDTLGSCQGFHKRLLKWLVHWGLAAEMVGGHTWFIPSILPPRSNIFHSPFVKSPFNPFPLSICFLENSSNNFTFHYLPEGFFPHFVVNLVKNGYMLSPNRREGANLSRCRDAVFLIKRSTPTVNPMNTFNIWLLDEATHLSIYMSPGGGSSAPSAHQEAEAVLADLKDKVQKTSQSLYYCSKDNIAICCTCPCPTTEGGGKAEKAKSSHLAQVTYDDKSSRAKIFCLDPGRLACWERHVSKDELTRVENCNFLQLIMEISHGCTKEVKGSTNLPITSPVKSVPDLAIKSSTDLLPYLEKMKAQLYLLGCALGIQDETAAIEKTSEDSTTKCLRVLEHWLKVTTNPSWSLLCSKLKMCDSFNNVREQMEKDHFKKTGSGSSAQAPNGNSEHLS